MSIQQNLQAIKAAIPEYVTLVAVSKTKPNSDIMDAYNAGQRVFGENKIQEMADKHAALPKDISWHMIGHVQRNKVKYMAPFVSLIHGMDSFKLLKEINKQAEKESRVIDCLIQVKIAEEDSKFGMSKADAISMLQSEVFKDMEHVRLIGVMGMATFTDDTTQVTTEFNRLKSIFNELKAIHSSLEIISMGMSGDYELAINCGSNMIRLGSSIFGERNY